MQYSKHTLKNGLRVILSPMKGVESVTAMIMVAAGSRYEEKEINGISHFLEHMAFKGTEKRPTALDIAGAIDGIGGEFNAFTSKDHTAFYVKSAAKHLPLLVDILSDMLLHSKFDEVEIEKEKGVIIEEINMYEDMPMRKIGDLFENLMYGDTKLGRDIAGTEDVIKSVKREDFISYMDRFYGPGNTIIVIAGGIGDGHMSEESVLSLVEGYLGNWPTKQTPVIEPADDRQTEPKLLVYFKDTQQAHICLGMPSYHLTHPARYKLSVMSNILGGGMSSRLFIEVREKRGLAYYVRASNEMYHDVGNFSVQAGVDVERIDDAIKVILSELKRIKSEPVTEEELIRAKEYMKGRFILDLEDSRSVASYYASDDLLEDQIKTPEEIIARIDAVTIQDVQDVAFDIFKGETLNLAVIGPYKEEERFRSLLKF